MAMAAAGFTFFVLGNGVFTKIGVLNQVIHKTQIERGLRRTLPACKTDDI
jgi:hypothetical protein